MKQSKLFELSAVSAIAMSALGGIGVFDSMDWYYGPRPNRKATPGYRLTDLPKARKPITRVNRHKFKNGKKVQP